MPERLPPGPHPRWDGPTTPYTLRLPYRERASLIAKVGGRMPLLIQAAVVALDGLELPALKHLASVQPRVAAGIIGRAIAHYLDSLPPD